MKTINDTTLNDVAYIDYGLALRGKTPQEGVNKYGDVKFADEKNKKYPIDTEEHIRAAWSYINKKKNAAEYSSEELAEGKGKIVAAWKDKVDPAGPPKAKERSIKGVIHINDPHPLVQRDASAFEMLIEEIDTREADQDARSITMAFSSETPVPGRTGMEVLDHGAGADFSRLNNGAPVLLNHNPYDQIGVVEKAWIGADRKGRAKVRFSKNPHANEIFKDVKDGIRRNVSVGYDHSDPVAEVAGDSGIPGIRAGEPIMRIGKWMPMELSIVSIPADATVGVARSGAPISSVAISTGNKPNPELQPQLTEKTIMEPTAQETRDAAIKAERDRVAGINELTGRMKKIGVGTADELAAKAIREGTPVEDFTADAFKEMESKKLVVRATESEGRIGLTEKEAQTFSFRKIINAFSEKGGLTDKGRQDAAFELEVSAAARALPGVETRGNFSIPYEVLRAKSTRAALSATGSDVVATHLLAQDFIEYLYKNAVTRQAGAVALDGLVGNVTIPSRTGTATGYWLSTDTSALTESETAFGQISLTPHTYTGFTKYSRQLLAQSTPNVEMLVRDDLAQILALGLDAAVIDGSGTNGQPTGILNAAGLNVHALGSDTGGSDGGAPTYTGMVDLMGFLMKNNAYKGKLAWLINGEGFETMATTLRNSASTVPIYIINDPYTQLLGHPIFISEQVPNNLTVSTSAADLSAVIFGNFADILIGSWGGLDILVDPYTFAANSTVGVYAYQMNDVGIRHIASFSAIVDMITT